MADDTRLSDSPASVEPIPAEKPSKNPLRLTALFVVVIAIALFALSVAMERLTPSSSQAVVQAYVVRMAAEVAGRVHRGRRHRQCPGEAGQVLFRIDPRPYEIAVAEAQAQLERIGQTLGASTQAVESAQAKLVKAQADRENVRAQVGARPDPRRARGLCQGQGSTRPTRRSGVSSATVTGAEADLAKAREELGPQGNDNPQFKEALAALERARLNLLHTTVVAPSDGVVTNLQLGVGQVVGAGQAALTFIDAGTIWIAAAYKENSLEYVTPDNRCRGGPRYPARHGLHRERRERRLGRFPEQRRSRDRPADHPQPERLGTRAAALSRATGLHGPPATAACATARKSMWWSTPGDNPVMNAVGRVWIRLVSVLTYVS